MAATAAAAPAGSADPPLLRKRAVELLALAVRDAAPPRKRSQRSARAGDGDDGAGAETDSRDLPSYCYTSRLPLAAVLSASSSRLPTAAPAPVQLASTRGEQFRGVPPLLAQLLPAEGGTAAGLHPAYVQPFGCAPVAVGGTLMPPYGGITLDPPGMSAGLHQEPMLQVLPRLYSTPLHAPPPAGTCGGTAPGSMGATAIGAAALSSGPGAAGVASSAGANASSVAGRHPKAPAAVAPDSALPLPAAASHGAGGSDNSGGGTATPGSTAGAGGGALAWAPYGCPALPAAGVPGPVPYLYLPLPGYGMPPHAAPAVAGAPQGSILAGRGGSMPGLFQAYGLVGGGAHMASPIGIVGALGNAAGLGGGAVGGVLLPPAPLGAAEPAYSGDAHSRSTLSRRKSNLPTRASLA